MPMFELAEWQAYKQRRDAEKRQTVLDPHKIWEWESEHIRGIEGVDTRKDDIEWYEQSHSRYGQGNAHRQSYEAFLETGPHIKLPNNQILDELYDAVRQLAGK